MELDHEFTVPVPLDQAWPVLLDVERVAPCMPGATLDSVEADEFTGRLKVKLGAMTITYKGTARFASRDESTHTVTIEGMGKEARGAGTASATVQAQLHGEGERTRVTVHTKLNVTGRPAQFGRNILSEVGGKLVGRFADNLAAELAGETPAAETAAEPAEAAEPQIAPAEAPAGDGTPQATTEARRPARSEDAIDLLEFAGPSVVKRVVPLIVGLAALWALWRLLRRSRR
jgi:carbon monoxide dehydrogenase subunit G